MPTFVLLRYSLGDRLIKLPTRHGPRPSLWPGLEHQTLKVVFQVGSMQTGVHAVKASTYPASGSMFSVKL